MLITIQSFTLPCENLADGAYTLRTWYPYSFLDSSGQAVASGTATTGMQLRSDVTVSAGFMTFDPYTVYSTLDAQVPNPQSLQIQCQVFKGNTGLPINPFNQSGTPSSWIVPDDLGATISFEEWTIANQRIVLANPPQTFYTAAEVDALIAAAVAQTAANQDYVIGDYASFAAAITAVTVTGGTLVINAATTCPNSLTVPANITLRFTRKGSVTITDTKTLTIVGPIEADPVKIFFNATIGHGTVSFVGNAGLREIYPEWWGAVANGSTDCHDGVQAAFDASQTLILPVTLNAGVPIVFGVGRYLFTTGVSYLAAVRTSIVIKGQGYSTEFIANGDITILTLNQGTSSDQGMEVSGIYFYLAGFNAAAIDLTFGGQLANIHDIWVNSPSATGNKRLVSICGEFITLDNIQIQGTAGGLNTNVGLYLSNQTTHGLYRIWMSKLQLQLLSTGLSLDTTIPDGASLVIKESSATGCVTALDMGGTVLNVGLSQSSWLIQSNQFESNTVDINLHGKSGAFQLKSLTIANNYFTGLVAGQTAIQARNVDGFHVLRNHFRNDGGTDHTGVAMSLVSGIQHARKEGNVTLIGPPDLSVDMTIAGNATGGQTSQPVFVNASLSSDGVSNDQLTDPLVGRLQFLSGAGAVNLTALTTEFTSTGGGQALTLANGASGQIKTITHTVDGGSGVLTPTTKIGFSTITFTNVGDSVTLQYFKDSLGTTEIGWAVIGSYGVVIAP